MRPRYELARRWKRVRRFVLRKPDIRGALLARMPKQGVCAEIGVWRGEFSMRILRVAEPRRLHLIDPWLFLPQFPTRGYGGSAARNQHDMDRMFEAVRRRLGALPNVSVHRACSHEALARFDDGTFDWLYIDGNHYYEYVRRDLELSLRKVKPDGVIAGDDYDWGEVDGLPVRQAVADFVAAHALGDALEVFGSQFIIRVPRG